MTHNSNTSLPKLLMPALKTLEKDLLARAKTERVEAGLKKAWEDEQKAGQTGLGFDPGGGLASRKSEGRAGARSPGQSFLPAALGGAITASSGPRRQQPPRRRAPLELEPPRRRRPPRAARRRATRARPGRRVRGQPGAPPPARRRARPRGWRRRSPPARRRAARRWRESPLRRTPRDRPQAPGGAGPSTACAAPGVGCLRGHGTDGGAAVVYRTAS